MPSIIGKEIGDTAYGLMGFTSRPYQTPDEDAFSAMKAALAHGANFWNSSEFYGERTAPLKPTDNLPFLPVLLSVKGGIDLAAFKPDGSPAGIKRSIEASVAALDGKKKIDIFECARVDKDTPIETTIAVLAEYVKDGTIGGIGLSESSAATIRRAHAVHPIAAVEVEFSLWSTEILYNGVAETCAELGIPIVGYSPRGRGFLTGQIRSNADIPDGEYRKNLPRFQPGNFEKNLQLVDAVKEIADKKGVTASQLALAWIKHQSGRGGKPVIIPLFGAVKDTRVKENMKKIEVTDEEVAEIDKILKSIEIVGGRYTKEMEHMLFV
ncbi:NADP-dependent oxidoreductase domain-containing protein [Morchella snyderi]|nr:NADP-dependent oxidoreductase domain-containing protein [Morchella snyderi]